MCSLMEKIKEAINSGDPVASQFILVRQTYLPFTLCGIYILFSLVIGPRIMENKRPLNLRIFMVFYNFCIIFTYMGCILLYIWNLQYVKFEQLCKEAIVKIGDTLYKEVCIMWVLYVIKYAEFLDTVFFILRKKQNQLTFFHIMHHSLTPVLAWLIIRTERSRFQFVVALINAVTHVIMYTYYGLSAIGPHCKKYLWWSKYLAHIEMIQLVLIILYVVVVPPLFNCKTGIFTVIVELFVIPFFLYIFYKYYKSQFKIKKESEDKYVIVNRNV